MPAPSDIVIRSAAPSDVPLILALIRELAEYERLTHEVVTTEALLHEALFGQRPVAEALLAEVDGGPAGFALFFRNYSTFIGREGIHLEDLYVRPQQRGCGVGKALLMRIIQLAHERGCGRVEWSVLDWNEPAIGFYQSLGARPMHEWTVWRLSGDDLRRLARGDQR